MIPSKLQFDHSREFRQKLNQYEKKKEEEKPKRVQLLRWVTFFPASHEEKEKNFDQMRVEVTTHDRSKHTQQ